MTTLHNMFRNAAANGLKIRNTPKANDEKIPPPQTLQQQATRLRKQIAKLTKELSVVEAKIANKEARLFDRQENGVTYYKAAKRR